MYLISSISAIFSLKFLHYISYKRPNNFGHPFFFHKTWWHIQFCAALGASMQMFFWLRAWHVHFSTKIAEMHFQTTPGRTTGMKNGKLLFHVNICAACKFQHFLWIDHFHQSWQKLSFLRTEVEKILSNFDFIFFFSKFWTSSVHQKICQNYHQNNFGNC